MLLEAERDGSGVTVPCPVMLDILSLSLALSFPPVQQASKGSLQFWIDRAVMPLYSRQSLFPDFAQATGR